MDLRSAPTAVRGRRQSGNRSGAGRHRHQRWGTCLWTGHGTTTSSTRGRLANVTANANPLTSSSARNAGPAFTSRAGSLVEGQTDPGPLRSVPLGPRRECFDLVTESGTNPKGRQDRTLPGSRGRRDPLLRGGSDLLRKSRTPNDRVFLYQRDSRTGLPRQPRDRQPETAPRVLPGPQRDAARGLMRRPPSWLGQVTATA